MKHRLLYLLIFCKAFSFTNSSISSQSSMTVAGNSQFKSVSLRLSPARLAVDYTDFAKVNRDANKRVLINSRGERATGVKYPHHYTGDSKFIFLPNPNTSGTQDKFLAYSSYLSTVVFSGSGIGKTMRPQQLVSGSQGNGLWLEAVYRNTEIKKFQGLFHQEQSADYQNNRTYKSIIHGESDDGLSWKIKGPVLTKNGGLAAYHQGRGQFIRGVGDFTVVTGDKGQYGTGKSKTPLLLFYFNQGTRHRDGNDQDGSSLAMIPDWRDLSTAWKWSNGNGSQRNHYQSNGREGFSRKVEGLFEGGSVARQPSACRLLAIADAPTSSGAVNLAIASDTQPTRWSRLTDPILQVSNRQYFKYFNFADDTGSSNMDNTFYITYAYRDALNQSGSPFQAWEASSAGQYSSIVYHQVTMSYSDSSKPKVGLKLARHTGKDDKGQAVQQVSWALSNPPSLFQGNVYQGIAYSFDRELGYVYTSNSGYQSKMDALYLVYSEIKTPQQGRYRIVKNLTSKDIAENKGGYVVQFLGYAWKPNQNPNTIKAGVLQEYRLTDSENSSYGYFLEGEKVSRIWKKTGVTIGSIEY